MSLDRDQAVHNASMRASSYSRRGRFWARRAARGLARIQRAVMESLELRQMLSVDVVTTSADSGLGSLRQTIASAAPGDTIKFSASLSGGSITLTSGPLVIEKNLTIMGPGAGSLSVSGDGLSQVFDVYAGQTVSISGLTITGGYSQTVGGGGVDNAGDLTLTNDVITGNTVSGGAYAYDAQLGHGYFTASDGGGVLNSGTLNLDNCTIDGDSAVQGGGVANSGVLNISGGSIYGNTATGASYYSAYFSEQMYKSAAGGGIFNSGTSTLDSFTVSGDSAQYGGGIYNYSGSVSIDAGIFHGNNATVGGAIDNNGHLSLLDSQFSYNDGVTGGAISNQNVLNVDRTSFYHDYAGGRGGAIFNRNELILNRSTIKDERAYAGGGIYNYGLASIGDSTLSGDSASGVGGGGIYNYGNVNINNSTFFGDTAYNGAGGALDNSSLGIATVVNGTIDGNHASVGAGIDTGSQGDLTIDNTIVAGNLLDDNVTPGDIGGTVDANLVAGQSPSSNNIVGDGSGGLSAGHHNILGSVAHPVNPVLSPLANNGGPTYTMALGAGSPALGAGSISLAVNGDGEPLLTDQRGYYRIVNNMIDIGAFEHGATQAPSSLLVNNAGDGDNNAAGQLTLRQAVAFADFADGNSTIMFAPSIHSITLTAAYGPLDLSNPAGLITIDGPGETSLTVSGGNHTEVFYIDLNTSAAISGMTITGGNNSASTGGAIYNSISGDLSLSNVVLSNNTASDGGAIDNHNILTIDDAIFADNSAGDGAAIDNNGTLNDTGSTFYGNVATNDGGAIDNNGNAILTGDTIGEAGHAINSAYSGGGIQNNGNLVITGGSFSLNKATDGGGAIYNQGNSTVAFANFSTNSALTGGAIDTIGIIGINNSTFSGDSATGATPGLGGGGGIANEGVLSVENSTFNNESTDGGGGGIQNLSVALITASTFSNDSTTAAGGLGGGGIYNDGSMVVDNSTFAFDKATGVSGGAIDNDSDLTVTNSTIAYNLADSGGGIFSSAGTGDTTLYNSIVAQNTKLNGTTASDLSGNLDANLAAGQAPSGYNLIGTGGSGGLTNTDGNMVCVAAPYLSPLGNWGGPTETIAPLPGSPAINAGSNALAVDAFNKALPTDQRGQPRIEQGTVDIGAVETGGYVLTAQTASQSTTVDTQFSQPLTVVITADNGLDPVAGANVSFMSNTGNNGQSAMLSSADAVASDGQTSVTAVANGDPGMFTVVASIVGVAPATFDLTNDQADIDLTVTNMVDNSTPNVGSNITYTITVTNGVGYGTATNVELTDMLPAGETFVSDPVSQGSYDPGTGIWTIGTLASGSTATLSFIANVNAFSTQTNTASITAADQPDVSADTSAQVTVNPQEIDLSVTKSVNNSTPDVGNNVTYTVTVSNAGSYSTATNISLSDMLPAGESLVSATPSAGTFSGGVWSIPSLASGATATLTYVATVNTFASQTNTASVTAADQTDIGSNLSASVTVNPQEIDLSVTKAVNNSTPNVGANVTYTVTVTNATGYSGATNVSLSDMLPAGESLVSATPSTGTFSGGVWSIPSLPAGASATLTYVATVNTFAAQTNTASVTGSDQPDVGTNLSASVTVNPQEIDLSVTKSVNNSTPNVGANVTYTVTVTNATGYSGATNVSLSDMLPAGESLVSATPSVGTFSGGVWSIPSLAAGASATLTYVVTVNTFAAQTNTATVTAADQTEVGTNLSASVTVNPQEIDLSVTKSVDNSTPNVGANVTYTVTVTNATGFSGATNVSLSDMLPAGESLVSATPSVGTFSGGVWSIPSLASGATATLTYVATVNTFAAQTNTATVSAAGQTDIGSNLSASVTVNPQEIDLSVTKSVDNSTPNVGANVTYTVTVTNATGYSGATNVSLSDMLPAGESLVSATPSTGTFSGGVWSIPSLPAGASATLTYVATVNTFAAQTNTATVSASDQTDIGTNLSASVTVNPREIDLSVTKSVNNSTPNVGANVTYTVTVTNATGYSGATNVSLSDMLPAGESLVSATPSVGTFSGGVWSIPSLAAGASATLTYVATVNTFAAQTNTATVTAADQTEVGTNLSASVTVNPQEIDLSVTKAVNNSTPNVGANVTYTVTVTNATGYSGATNVSLSDMLPAGESLVSATPSAGTFSGGVWSIPSLASGATATLTYIATVNTFAAQTNTASVTAADQTEVGTNLSASVTVNPQEIDLSVTKAVNNSTPNVGANVTYSVTATNGTGFSGATNVSLSDMLPAGESLVSATPSTGTFSGGVWSIPSLPAGASATLTYVATVNTFAAQTNTASVTGADQTDIGADLSASVTVNPQEIDLSVTKAVDNSTPNVGANVTYTVTVTNATGYTGATNVSLSDMLPAGESLVSATPSTGTFSGGVWSIPSLAAGASATLSYVATVNTFAAQTNTATVTSSDQTDIGADLSASVTVNPQEIDLNVTKTVDNSTPNVGTDVTYTITVSDASGYTSATGVSLSDPLPSGETLVSAVPSQGTFSAGVWTIGSLPAGTSVTLVYIAQVNVTDAITNTATVSAPGQTDAGANQSASVTIYPMGTIIPQEIDLNVTKTVDNSTPYVGSDVTYTITVSNGGGVQDAQNVSLSDMLPGGETFISATPSAGTFSSGVWTIGTLASGATVTLTEVAQVNVYAPLTNTATVSAPSQTDVGTNLSASVTVNPQEIDLSVTKSVNNSSPNVGANITYTVTVTNANGYSTATNISLSDMLPAGESLVSATPFVGTYSGGVWSIPSLAAGATATLTYVTTVNAFAPQTNTASVTSSDQPDIGTSLSASVTVNPQEVDLSVTKTVNNSTPNVGANVTYTVTVSNATGYSTATSVSLTDLLPSGESLVSATPSVGTYSGGVWSIPSLATGASATLSYVATVNTFASQTNTATITSSAQPDVGTNLSASVTVNPQEIDLSVTKSVNNSTPSVGANVTYTVTVTNATGYSTATSVSLSDMLPAGESLVSTTPSTGTFSGGVWSIPSLAAGSTATLTYIATVNTFAPQTNTASITSASQTDIGTNLSASVTVNPQEIDLSVTKSVNNSTPNVGANVTYTVTVTNATGYSGATSVSLSDVLPAGESLVSATPSTGTFSGGVWSIPSLAAGSTATLTYVATVNTFAAQTNTATITSAAQTDIGTTLSASVTVNPQEVDLSVTKTVNNSTPNVGANVTYTVTVSNATGYSTATSVSLTDLLPSGESLVSATPSTGTYSGGVWSIPSLAAGASATLTYVATVNTFAAQTNTATITSSAQPDVGTNLSASVTVNPQEIDLSVTKTVNNATPNVGANVTYTVTVTNATGYSTATSVSLSDMLPAGESLVSTTPSTGTFSGGVWSIPSLAAGSTATLTYVATVNTFAAQTNTASVTSASQTDVGTNLSASVTVNPQEIDLNVTKTVNNSTPNVGSNVSYTVTVTNAAGYSGATSVSLSDVLPAGESLVSATPSTGTYSGGVWSIPTLASGASATLSYVATVNTFGAKTNTATITSAAQTDIGSTLSASVTVNPQEVDLSVTKTVNNSTPNVGANVTYTVIVSNATGYSTATSVSLTDLLPAGETLVSATPSTGTYSGGVWSIPSLTAGASATLTYVAKVNTFAPQTNTATITSSAQPDAGTNLSASVTVNPQEVDLSVTKAVNNSTPNVGSNVTYTVTVTNATGYSTATSVSLSDVLPGGETLVSATPSTGTFSGGVWSIPSLASGASATLTYVATVNAFAAQTNTASVTSSAQPDVGTNLSASVTVNPQEIDLSVTKTVSDATQNCSIPCNFNGTSISGGSNLWFNCNLNPTIPTGCTSVTYTFTNCQINFTAGNVNYCINAPNASVTYSSTCTTATTTYNSATNCWVTTCPISGLAGNTFLNGCTYNVPTGGLPGGIQNVTWCGHLAASQPNCSAHWQWAAACYNNNFSSNYGNLGVKPCDDNQASSYKNSDHCGTPENCKSYVCGGATGGGGSNCTGSYSGTGSCSNLPPSTGVVNVGDTVQYVVTVSNATGYSTATDVVLKDLLPSGETFVAATPSQGTYNATTGIWTIGTLASGSTATLTYTAVITTTAPVTNTATITGADQTDIGSPLSASVTVNPVVPQIDLSIVKSESTAQTCLGNNVTYTVTLTNAAGYSTATGVSVNDMLPSGLTYVSATPSQGAYSSSTGIWSVGTVAGGGSATLTVTAKTSCYGIYVNTATITAAAQTEVGTNLQSSVTLIVGAALTGTAFVDNNGDCTQDPGDAGLAGVTVELVDSSGKVVLTTTTGTNGTYSFLGVAPGTFTIEFIAPGSYVVGSIDGTTVSNCGSSYGNGCYNSGNYNYGSGCGSYSFNYCGNSYSGYTGGTSNCGYNYSSCGGSYSYTYCDSGNSNWNWGNWCSGGNWCWGGSSYGGNNYCGNGNDDNCGNGGNVATSCVTLVCGTTLSGVNAGVYQTSSIGNFVWVDSNGNGLQDAGEPGINCVTVKLLASTGNSVLATTTTNSQGYYSFSGLAPGQYVVQFIAPSGYVFTQQDVGTNNAINSDASPTTGRTNVITLTSGEADTTEDAGLYQPACVSGVVYVDYNDDTTANGSSQTGLSGITVMLLNNAGQVVQTTTTGNGGSYSFGGIAAGTYSVYVPQSQSALTGFLGYRDDPGTVNGAVDGSVTGSGIIGNVVLKAGNSGVNYNFGQSAQGQTLTAGDTGSVGFWATSAGQNLLYSLNGGSNCTTLGNWLASTYTNLYGRNCGSYNLSSKTNAQVYAIFVGLNNNSNLGDAAEVLACAFNCYVTNSTLSGTVASNYGFTTEAGGCGNKMFNVWNCGAACGVANYTVMSVSQIVLYCNTRAVNGNLYAGNTTLQAEADTVFTAINQAGQIGSDT